MSLKDELARIGKTLPELIQEGATLLEAAQQKMLEDLAPEVQEMLSSLSHVVGEEAGARAECLQKSPGERKWHR